MKAIIIGGGIGGLTLALMLQARGFAFELYEQAETIRELGVGINVLPPAVRVLRELGLLDDLDAVAVRTRELRYLTRLGQEVWREARGLEAGHDAPQISIHRGRLQGVLLRALHERGAAHCVRTGHRLAWLWHDRDGVSCRFIRSKAGPHIARGEFVIGSDGIDSRVRSYLFSYEGPPRWNRHMIWRGAVDWPAFLSGASMIVAGGLDAKLVLYPIGEGSSSDRRLTNWAVVTKIADGGLPPRREDWSRPGRRDELMPHVAGFQVPEVDLAGLISATPAFWEYPMCDRDPLPSWRHDRVTLLGDAAHPMYPVGSNGATQAILDAHCLAECLAVSRSNLDDALARYEDTRRPATTAIVLANRQGGPEKVIDAVEAIAPNGFDDVEDVLPLSERAKLVCILGKKPGPLLPQP